MNTETNVTAAEIDAMTAKRLNQFVLENDLDNMPENFIDMSLTDKQQTVKAILFGGDLPAAAADPEPTAPEPKPAKAAPAKKAPAKKAAKKAPAKKAAPAKKPGTALTPAKMVKAGKADIVAVSMPAIKFENITTEAEAVKLAQDLVEVGDYALFHLGGVFARMADEGWYMGHSDFKKCCEAEFNVRYRKAAYLMKIFRTITEKGIDWQDVSKVGWTKLKELLPVITPQNAKAWAEKAANLSTYALIEHVKSTKADTPTPVKEVATKTFKLHADQKQIVEEALKDAREKADTDVDSVALELICTQYLSEGGITIATKPNPVDAKKVMQDFFAENAKTKAGIQTIVDLLTEYFPDTDVSLEVPDDYE